MCKINKFTVHDNNWTMSKKNHECKNEFLILKIFKNLIFKNLIFNLTLKIVKWFFSLNNV